MTRPATIIVGSDGSERSRDALAFAAQLAHHGTAAVMLAGAFPGAEATLARIADTAPVPVEVRALDDPWPARALHRLARDEQAALIAIGSSHPGAARPQSGSTAGRVVHHSPCAIAVVPTGHDREAARRIERIGCAFDGSPEAEAALAAAVDAAQAVHADLEVIRGLPAAASLGEPASAQLHRAVAAAAGRVRCRLVLEPGEPAGVLAARSTHLDLLFVGSRGHGQGRTLHLGSVTQRLLVQAHCPVIVLPRGAEPMLAAVFASGTHVGIG